MASRSEPSFFSRLFEQFGQVKAAVIGDIMLDSYWWGEVDRISPEAPVPVLNLKRKEVRPGGAANVAGNLRALGAEVQLFSVTGPDEEGGVLKKLLDLEGIDSSQVLTCTGRVTTTKTRIIGRHQQIVRVDREDTRDLDEQDVHYLLDRWKAQLKKDPPRVVILEDYNKGVLTEGMIREVLNSCRLSGIPTLVDPKQQNFLAYKGATVFKPNLKEIWEGLHMPARSPDPGTLEVIHRDLLARLEHEVSLITLSEQGVFVAWKGGQVLIPSHLRNISDVSGAGDTVVASAALVWALTQNPRLMAEVANIAGGLVCEEVGVVRIDRNLLLAECRNLLGADEGRVPP